METLLFMGTEYDWRPAYVDAVSKHEWIKIAVRSNLRSRT